MTIIIILISTFLCFLVNQPSLLSNQLSKWFNSLSSEEKQLLKQKQQLKDEQKQYNMVDNFAKYSKIQRKINAIDEQLKETKENRHTISSQMLAKYAPQALCTLSLLILTIYYRRTPLFKLPNHIDLAPFNYIISYPNEKNQVSFHFWIMSCNVVARIIKIH